MSFVPRLLPRSSGSPGAGGGGVPAGATAQVYTLASASSVGDPSVILTTPVVAADTDDLVFTIDTPSGGAAAATLPAAGTVGGAYVEWLIRDLDGNVQTIAQSDKSLIWAWIRNATGILPLDVFVAIAITGGGVADPNNSGTIHGLVGTAAGNTAWFTGNAGVGSGWVARGTATATDATMVGLIARTLKSSSSSATYRQTVPIDASGQDSGTINTTLIPVATNTFTDGPMSHIAIVVGWIGAAGGTDPQEIRVSLRSNVAKLSQISGWQPDRTPSASVLTSPPLRLAILGDSNGNGTQVDGTYGGVAVPAGWTIRSAGANTTTYPAIASPGVGPMGRLIDNAIARGASSGTRWLARRATNGADTSFPGTVRDSIVNLIADCVTLGGGDPHILVVVFGANDAQSASEAAAYLLNMIRMLRIWANRYPLCKIVLYKERNNAGLYPNMADIQAHIDTISASAEFAGRVMVADSTIAPVADLFDDIHFTPAGHVTMADRAFTALYGV